jgi:hypothetical protein
VVVLEHDEVGQLGYPVKTEAIPDWLDPIEVDYDGHTTEVKHQRLQRWTDALTVDSEFEHVAWPTLIGGFVGAFYGPFGAVLGMVAGAVLGVNTMYVLREYRRSCVKKQKTPFWQRWLTTLTDRYGVMDR